MQYDVVLMVYIAICIFFFLDDDDEKFKWEGERLAIFLGLFFLNFFFLFIKFVCCKFPVFRRFKNRFETLVKVYMEIASVWFM